MVEPSPSKDAFPETTIASLRETHVINPQLADGLVEAGIETVADYVALTNEVLKQKIPGFTPASVMQFDGYVRSKGHPRVEELSTLHLRQSQDPTFAEHLKKGRGIGPKSSKPHRPESPLGR